MEPSVQGGRRPGLLQHVLGLFTEPAEAFQSILRKPRVLAPLIALVLLQALFTVVWRQRVDVREFMKAEVEQSSRWDRVPVDQREQVLDAQERIFPYLVWLGPLVLTPLIVVLAASVYLFVFRFFLVTETTFKQSLAVVAHAFLVAGAGVIVGLVTGPLSLLVLFLRDDWTINPQVALQANLSLLLDREEAPKFLWSFAESLDLFSFWALWLLAAGYAVAASRPWSWALPGVLGPWALYVVGKSALAGLF